MPTLQEQEQLIKQQFAETRKGLEGQKRRSLQSYEDQMKRFAAANQMQGSGALVKAQGRQTEDIARTFGELEGSVGAQEAQALQAAKEAETQREFATKERLGSQEFAASEAEKQRALATEQFNKQFEEMKKQWSYEFDENLKTNMINAAIALRDAELDNPDAWKNMLGPYGSITSIYGNRAPAYGGREIGKGQQRGEYDMFGIFHPRG